MATLRTKYYQLENYFMGALSIQFIQFAKGIELYISRESSPFFNFIYVHQLRDENKLFQARAYMEERCHHYLIVADESIGLRLMPIISDLGIQFDMATTAMTLSLEGFCAQVSQENITIECMNQDLQSWLVPLQSAFEISSGTLAQQYIGIHRRALDKQTNMSHFVLNIDNEPITSLTLTMQDDCARLDDIGTVLSHQGRGYASKLIYYALQFAQAKGIKHCFLEASDDGLSMYERIGFQRVFNYYSFVY